MRILMGTGGEQEGHQAELFHLHRIILKAAFPTSGKAD
jgi:hypothetical protein